MSRDPRASRERSGDPGTGRVGGRVLVAVLAALATSAAVAAPASGQVPAGRLGAGFEFQSYGFDDVEASGLERLSLLTVPVAGQVELHERLTVSLGGHWARGELERSDGTTSEISGLTDTELTASVRLGPDAVTITAVGMLPTGRSSYSLEELDVAGAIAADLLPFRISNWGSGGGFGLRTSAARQLGAVGAALSAGYFVSGEFDPVEDEVVAYQPGDNLQLRGALDAPVGSAGKVGLQGSVQLYGDDTTEGTNLFRAGDRWQVLANYAFPMGGAGAGYGYGGLLHRGEGTHLQDLDPVASQDLYLLGAGARIRVDETLLMPTVDVRWVTSDGNRDEGMDVRLGASAEWPLGAVTAVPVLRLHVGNLELREGRESGFTGFDVGLTLRARGGP